MPPVVEVLEQPTAVRAATERMTASRALQRRRRGRVKRSMQASVAPEPAAYHGALPEGWCLMTGLRFAAVVVKAEMTNEVVTPLAELIVIGVTVKLVVAFARSVLVATRLTGPVNPLTGVTVKVIPEATDPGATLTAPVQGLLPVAVNEKSGLELETKSTEARVPLIKAPVGSGARSAPLELAKVPSPKYAAVIV